MRAVTVLMAVYRTPLEMLERAIDSILDQSFRDFEFLMVDDGSGDEELSAYLAGRGAADTRIRVVEQPHRGLTAALNRGIELARGEFLARQDADDWSEPVRLERQIGFLRTHPEVVVCGSDAWTHQQNARPLWRVRPQVTHAAILDAFQRGNPFVHGSVMFRRGAARAAGGYREALCCSQDYDFFWRLAETGGAANLPEALYHYRYTGGSVSAVHAAEQAVAHQAARSLASARQEGQPEDLAAALAEAQSELAGSAGTSRALLKQADHLMLAGEYRRAWRAYTGFLRAHPASVLAWGKLARLGVFLAAPPAREACFR